MKKILVVEDNQLTIDLLVYALKKEGYEVMATSNGQDTFEILKNFMPNLVTLDLVLPDMDGFEICKKIKEKYDIPVIILSGKNDREDRVKGLKIGADDFMIKPFYPEELIIRIEHILDRYYDKEKTIKNIIRLKCGLNIDQKKREVIDTHNNEIINLTLMEYELLLFLVKNKNCVMKRDVILSRVWKDDINLNTRTVDTHIQRLRQKLGKKYRSCVASVRGIGYKFLDEELTKR